MGNSVDSTTIDKLSPQTNAQDQQDYFEQTITFNEQPFCIEGDKLNKILHRSVGALTFLNTKDKRIHAGSAALISRDSILTCAHNIYDKDSGSDNTEFKFYIGANGVAEDFYQVQSFRFPQEFKVCKKSKKLKSDYAIMKLKKPILFDQYLPLSQVCSECMLRDNQHMKLMIYGFPVFRQNFTALDEEGNKIKLFQYGLTRKNRIVTIDAQSFKMRYSISTIFGQSGCPVVFDNSIIAVHVGGDTGQCNIGRIVDASFIQSLSQWIKDLKATPYSIQEKQCQHKKKKEKKINLKHKELSQRPSLQTTTQKKMELTRKYLSFIDDEKSFMNSALLCFSHIKELAQYFVSNKYFKESNILNAQRNNKPELSNTFAKVLQGLWLENESPTSLSYLKEAIRKIQAKNSTAEFLDLSEFINYFLNMLHLDLNSVKERPNFQVKDYDGRPDKIIAKQTWQIFSKRNNSIITKLFCGQYKSIIYCTKCQHKSIQFQPFLKLSLPLVISNKQKKSLKSLKSMKIIFIKDHCEEVAVTVQYNIEERPTFKFAFQEVAKKLQLPSQTRFVAYAASYSSCLSLDDSTILQSAVKEHYYRSFFVRQLLKGEDPQRDTEVFLINKVKQSSYSYYSRKSISSARLYFFSKDLTYRQVHFKIYSYFKRLYEVSNYEIDVIKAQSKEKPFKILCVAQNRYNNCEYCNTKDCDGCELKFNDDKFMENVKVKIVEMEIEWAKNSKEIQEKMEGLRVGQNDWKPPEKPSVINLQDCFTLSQEPKIIPLPLVDKQKKSLKSLKSMKIIFIKDHCEEVAVTVQYNIEERPTFKFAFQEVAKKLQLPSQTRFVAYAASYSSCLSLDDSTILQSAVKEHYYRSFFVRQLLKGEDPQRDTEVFLINKVKQSSYSYYSRKSISSARLYFFSKDLTYRQVHFKIYSYFKRLYEVSNYEIDVIKAQSKEKPFKILCVAQNRYNNCEYCNTKDCDGCELKFNDDKFMENVKVKIVEMEIEWAKNSKEIQEKMEGLRVGQNDWKPPEKPSVINLQDCFTLSQEPKIFDKDNFWNCPKCEEFVLAKHEILIYKAPKILIIVLERFKVNEPFFEKLANFVDYPVIGLDLSNYVINPDLPHQNQCKNEKLIYDLISVSNHLDSTGGGYYTAYCKDIADNQWYEFKESQVFRVKDTKDVVSASGYVLFYRRRD